MKMPARRGETETSKHWGRAYQCLRCLKDHKEVIAEKYRLEDHIRKCHLSLDQLPFYCSLCLFRCTEKTQLEDHVTKYRLHAQILREKNVPDSPYYLKENLTPYIIGKDDYVKLSQEESVSYFSLRAQMKRSASDTQDLLSQAVQELEPLDPASSLNLSPDFGSPALQVLQTPAPAQQTGGQMSTGGSNVSEMWNLFTNFMAQVQKNQGTTPLQAPSFAPSIHFNQHNTSTVTCSTTNATSQASTTCYTTSQPATEQELRPHTTTITDSEEQPLDLSNSTNNQIQPLDLHMGARQSSRESNYIEPPQEARADTPLTKDTSDPTTEGTDAGTSNTISNQVEDIMPQLLGQEEGSCVTALQEESSTHGSPKEADKRIVQMGDRTKRLPTIQNLMEELRDSVEKGNKVVKEEVEKNSRAIRCLEKAIRDQTEATREQTQVMKDIKASMNNFISYYRTCAREERRRDEERSEREEKRRLTEKEENSQPKTRRSASPNRNTSLGIRSVLA
ncbi:MAG: hypothetical protein N0E48_19855, partial [Candidatus Thiodiazotropha endolucinida]|nr:hypothetical protein [Candidatus Thiodiazotropha taylori]MCW4345591.1 hypothetical protein [Candidatus Thiodiazotropha endolucinida]